MAASDFTTAQRAEIDRAIRAAEQECRFEVSVYVGPSHGDARGTAERLPDVVIARLLGLPDAAADDLLAWSHAMVAMYQARRDRAVEEAANAAVSKHAPAIKASLAHKYRA